MTAGRCSKGVLRIPVVGQNRVEIEALVVAAVDSFYSGCREVLPSSSVRFDLTHEVGAFRGAPDVPFFRGSVEIFFGDLGPLDQR